MTQTRVAHESDCHAFLDPYNQLSYPRPVCACTVPVHVWDGEMCDDPETLPGDPDTLCGHGLNREIRYLED